MKKLLLSMLPALLFASCADMNVKPPVYNREKRATVFFYPTDVDNLLSCIQESSTLERDEFDELLKSAEAKSDQGSDSDKLRYICLAFNERAEYRQFKVGMSALATYVEEHPEARDGLLGVQILVHRLNQEKIDRWNQRNRLLDAREGLEKELAECKNRLAVYEEGDESLVSEVKRLREKGEQDQIRINDLQNQIEQLKNIENIIKNREQ